jgi:hypothetical protein
MGVPKRSRGIAVASALLALPAGVRADPPSAAAETVQLRAAEIDVAPLPPVTRKMMRDELGVLLAVASIGVSWRTVGAGGDTQRDELSFVFLPRTGIGPDLGALASTDNHDLARTTWVYLPSVAATLGIAPDAAASSLDAQRLMGVALGRVLAHEVVHAMVPNVEHAQVGLMRARLGVQLVRGRPTLPADCAASLAAGARAWLAGGPRLADGAREAAQR